MSAHPAETVDDPLHREPSLSFLKYAVGFILAGVVAFIVAALLLAPGQGSRAL